MALTEISTEKALGYAREYVKQLSSGSDIITPDKLKSPDVSAGLNIEKRVFFSKVTNFLKDFANKGDFIDENKDLLTTKNLTKLAEQMVRSADERGDGNSKVSLQEADLAIRGFDPKSALMHISGKSSMVQR